MIDAFSWLRNRLASMNCAGDRSLAPSFSLSFIALKSAWMSLRMSRIVKMAIDALEKGKDVYLEKPVTLTIAGGASDVAAAARRTGRVCRSAPTPPAPTSGGRRADVESGMIGKMLMCQGSLPSQLQRGRVELLIDQEAGPDGKGDNYIDWKMYLGSRPQARLVKDNGADRFFRFRKYWDYSGGIATDLFFHVVAPLKSAGANRSSPSQGRGTRRHLRLQQAPRRPSRCRDTFMLNADYPKGHSLVLSQLDDQRHRTSPA